MILARQLAIGGADILHRRLARDSQKFVVVLFGCGCHLWVEPRSREALKASARRRTTRPLKLGPPRIPFGEFQRFALQFLFFLPLAFRASAHAGLFLARSRHPAVQYDDFLLDARRVGLEAQKIAGYFHRRAAESPPSLPAAYRRKASASPHSGCPRSPLEP